jgi:hypothetical protein
MYKLYNIPPQCHFDHRGDNTKVGLYINWFLNIAFLHKGRVLHFSKQYSVLFWQYEMSKHIRPVFAVPETAVVLAAGEKVSARNVLTIGVTLRP